jgi:hypothetical protein
MFHGIAPEENPIFTYESQRFDDDFGNYRETNEHSK